METLCTPNPVLRAGALALSGEEQSVNTLAAWSVGRAGDRAGRQSQLGNQAMWALGRCLRCPGLSLL